MVTRRLGVQYHYDMVRTFPSSILIRNHGPQCLFITMSFKLDDPTSEACNLPGE
jgi:hypothetical protein